MPKNSLVSRIITLCANEHKGCSNPVRYRLASAMAQDSFERYSKPFNVQPSHTIERFWAEDIVVDSRFK